MRWKKIRIDFTPAVKCSLCSQHRLITSGKAVVIINQDGDITYAGPSCAKDPEKIDNPYEKIPDLTRGSFEEVRCSTTTPSKNESSSSANTDENMAIFSENKAKEYFHLRFEKLSHIKEIDRYNSRELRQLYEIYIQSGEIPKHCHNYLNTIMFGKKMPKLTYRNLHAIYAADFWIKWFLDKNPNNKFAQSLYKQLHQKLSLSTQQVIGINNWFEHDKERTIKLKPTGFADGK